MWNPEGDLAKFVQFQKDVADASDTDVKETLKNWSCKDFIKSGYVRCQITDNKMCYSKPSTEILCVFKRPNILFSFDTR